MGSVIQSSIPSTDKIQFTLSLKMSTTQVVETSITVCNSPNKDYLYIVLTRLSKHVHAPTYLKSSYRNYKVVILHVDKIDVSLIEVNANH